MSKFGILFKKYLYLLTIGFIKDKENEIRKIQ